MSELNELFKGEVKAENLDATTPENAKINRDLGFKSHGLVIRDPQGTVVWKQADHSVNVEDAKAFLKTRFPNEQ